MSGFQSCTYFFIGVMFVPFGTLNRTLLFGMFSGSIVMLFILPTLRKLNRMPTPCKAECSDSIMYSSHSIFVINCLFYIKIIILPCLTPLL